MESLTLEKLAFTSRDSLGKTEISVKYLKKSQFSIALIRLKQHLLIQILDWLSKVKMHTNKNELKTIETSFCGWPHGKDWPWINTFKTAHVIRFSNVQLNSEISVLISILWRRHISVWSNHKKNYFSNMFTHFNWFWILIIISFICFTTVEGIKTFSII